MIAPEVVWVLGGSCVIGSVCAQQSCTAVTFSSAAARKGFLLWNLYAALDFSYFSFRTTIFSSITAVSGDLDFSAS